MAWQPKQAHPVGNVPERGVAAEELVAAQARDGDLEARLGCGLADEPGVDAVDAGLVHGGEDLGQIAAEFVFVDFGGCCG